MSETTMIPPGDAAAGTELKCPFAHGANTSIEPTASSSAAQCPVQHEPVVVIAHPTAAILVAPASCIVPANGTPSLFDSPMALAHSCYLAIPHPELHELGKRNQTAHIVPEGKLWPDDGDPRPSAKRRMLHDEFLQHVGHKMFPCMGAHNVLFNANHRVGVYGTMASIEATAGMGRDLRRFVGEQKQFGDAQHLKMTAFIAIFEEPRPTSEEEFEQLIWRQLQLLHDHDQLLWDPDFSCDPTSPDWAYSFAQRAFFVVGFNPHSSRTSRTFSRCALMFNAEYQVRALRDQGALPKWFANIRRADMELQPGSIHPTIAQLDDNSHAHPQSEAAVYSGIANDIHTWKCPFVARPGVIDLKKPAASVVSSETGAAN